MSSPPDPTRSYDAAKVFFMRKYLNIALDAPVPLDNPIVEARLEDLARVAEQDVLDLHREFERHPMPDFAAMSADETVAEIARTFPDEDFDTVAGSDTKVRINGVAEFDAAALRRLPPSQRKALFDATRMPEGDADAREAKRKALRKLGGSGQMRLRVPQNAEDGRAHLDDLVHPSQKERLDALYDAPETRIEDKYRAWDILNKINESDPPDRKRAEADRHKSVLRLALSLDPASLPDMVECFEFADLGLDRHVEAEALALARRSAEEDHARRVEQAKTLRGNLERAITAAEAKISGLEAQIAALDEGDPRRPGLQRQHLIQTRIRDGKEDKLRNTPPDPENHVARDPIPDRPASDDRRKALAALLERLETDHAAREALIREIETELSEYVAAVVSTGNKSGTCPCRLVALDILPNAGAAVEVADALRFGSDRAAAYHTQKHFDELSPADRDGARFASVAENRVDCYHRSARASVAGGTCVKSQIGQAGGESHHFKGAPCTAIVWLNDGKAGLATYFNK